MAILGNIHLCVNTIKTVISIGIWFDLIHLRQDLHQASQLFRLKLVVVPVHNHLDDVLVRAEDHDDDQHLVVKDEGGGASDG